MRLSIIRPTTSTAVCCPGTFGEKSADLKAIAAIMGIPQNASMAIHSVVYPVNDA